MARIYVLGAGTPTPTAERFGSSYVVSVGDDHIMFDCGPATTHKLAKVGLSPTQVGNLFFTHHHFDHDADYPCFLLSRWDQGAGQEQELRVFGPAPTVLMTERILGAEGAFSQDWNARVNFEGSLRLFVNRGGVLPRRPPSAYVRDVTPGNIASGRGWNVHAATAEHAQPWLDSLAYRLSTMDGDIVITGDTRPCQSIIDLAQGADLMMCMCWDHQDAMDASDEAAGSACGTVGAAMMAAEARVSRLVLVHMGPNVSTPDGVAKARRDIATVYDGTVVFADELMSLELIPGEQSQLAVNRLGGSPLGTYRV